MKDRIWYVPDGYDNFSSFTFKGWGNPLFFDQERPVCIEYCSGNGAWIAARAQRDSHYNWVAIELKFERVRKIWSKIKNFDLPNLLAVCGEGYRITHHYIPDNSVHEVYINFPDPWPKRRHGKNRIIQPSFISEIRRILRPGGGLTMVTDDVPYSRHMIEVVQNFPTFDSLHPFPFYVNDDPNYGTSFFEDLWRERGKKIYYHAFRKIG